MASDTNSDSDHDAKSLNIYDANVETNDHDNPRDAVPSDVEPLEDDDLDEGDDGTFADSEVSPAGGVADADVGEKPHRHAERKIDKALKESFDCPDAVSINPGAD